MFKQIQTLTLTLVIKRITNIKGIKECGDDAELTEQVSGLLRLADQRRPNSELVLGHDSELILVVLRQTCHHVGALLGVIGDVDPGLPVVLPLFHHVVGDLGSAVVCGKVPGQADPLRKHLGEFERSDGRAGRSCRGRMFYH